MITGTTLTIGTALIMLEQEVTVTIPQSKEDTLTGAQLKALQDYLIAEGFITTDTPVTFLKHTGEPLFN